MKLPTIISKQLYDAETDTEASSARGTIMNAPPNYLDFGTFSIKNCRPPETNLPFQDYPDYKIILHLDGDLSISRRTEGRTEKRRIKNGEVTITPVNQSLALCWDRPYSFLSIGFKPEFFDKIALETGDADFEKIQILDRFGVRDPLVELIGKKLQCEINLAGGEILNRFYLDSLVNIFAVRLLRKHTAKEFVPHLDNGKLEPLKLRKVVEFINEKLSEDLSLSTISAVVDLSPYHFARKLRRTINLTPSEYVTRLRLDKAKILLATTDLPIVEIALQIGFTSQSYFTSVFRRHVGTTPNLYRMKK